MKKTLFIIMVALSFSLTTKAQEIYSEIRKFASEHVNNPAENELVKKINRFELDALDYMGMKMKEVMPDTTATFLDDQAYALYTYINLYSRTLVDISTQPKAYQIKVIRLFMDASYSNPLFNDPDKDIVLSYFSNGDSITRFSLDTDWRRALAAVLQEIKKIQ